MREAKVVSYLGKQDVIVHADVLELPGMWGHENDALGMARDVMSRFESPILVDVGAGIGEWTLLAAALPELRVFAFEPQAALASLLRENVQLNGLYGQVNIYTIALGAEIGAAELKIPRKRSKRGLATLAPNPGFAPAETYSVAVATIDQFYTYQDPTLIKVDAEGGELDVLRGAKATVKRCSPAFVLEVQNKRTRQFGYDIDRILEWMRDRGYQGVKLDKRNRYFWKREEHRP